MPDAQLNFSTKPRRAPGLELLSIPILPIRGNFGAQHAPLLIASSIPPSLNSDRDPIAGKLSSPNPYLGIAGSQTIRKLDDNLHQPFKVTNLAHEFHWQIKNGLLRILNLSCHNRKFIRVQVNNSSKHREACVCIGRQTNDCDDGKGCRSHLHRVESQPFLRIYLSHQYRCAWHLNENLSNC